MAELIVHNPPRAALKASGYIGSPEGDIELTENDTTYNVADFATATTRIPKPPEPTGTKEIIENGVHDVKKYAFADVKIPEPSGTIALDENNRSYDVTDYATADVAIPEEEKTVTPSTVKKEILPDNGLLSKVTVLPAPLEERTVTPTIVQQTITPEAPAIGLSKVTVGAALPPPILVSKQITENGTYTAEEDNADGYSEVEVDVVASSKYIIDMSTNLHNKATDIPNTYLERGEETHYPNWSATDYIQIPEHFVFNFLGVYSSGIYSYSFLYKEDKTYIGEKINSDFIAGNKPSNAFYVRFSGTTSDINTMTMFPLEVEAECIVPASINTPLNFSAYNISVKSLIDILYALSNRTGQTAYALTLGTTNLNKLTAEQKAIATKKNWTLA